MSFWDNVKKFTQPYADDEYDDYDEDEYLDDYEEPVEQPTRRAPRRTPAPAPAPAPLDEEEDDDWSCDLYFSFRGGAELLVTSYTLAGALGFLLEVKGKKIQTQDPEEIQKYFAEN